MIFLIEFINFFRNEFFPDFLKFLNKVLETTFDLKLTYNQLAIIGVLLILMFFSLMVELLKKAIPLLILLLLIFYFVYGDLSFLENFINSFSS